MIIRQGILNRIVKILIQFVYYKMRRPDDHEGDINGDYVAINGHETEN